MTEGIHLTEQGITRPEIAFRKQRSCVSTRKPFSVNQDKPKMKSSCAICKTSASNQNLRKTAGDTGQETKSNTLNEVFTMKFPTDKCDPSPCLTLTFRALFQTPSFFANHFTTTGALNAQCTIASTCSPASCIRTVRRGVWRGVRPTAAD